MLSIGFISIFKKIIEEISLGPENQGTGNVKGKEPEFVLKLADEMIGDTFQFSGASEKVEGEEGKEESQETQNGIKEAVTGLLSKIFSNESVKKEADSDADGIITEEEAREYLTSIANGDEDASSLSLEDVEKALEDLEIDPEDIINEEIKKHLEETALKLKQEEVEKAEEKPTVAETAAPSASSAPRSASSGGSSSVYRGGSAQGSKAKDIKNMTIDELTTAITDKTSEISATQEELADVFNGTHPDLVSLKEAEDKAFEDYQNKIAEKSEEDAKDLGIAKEQVEGHKIALDFSKAAVTQTEGELTTINGQISGCDSRITSLENSVNSLISAINSAEEGTDTSGMQTKLSSAQAELQKAKDQKAELEAKKETLNKQLKDEEENVKFYQESYDKACESLEEIEEKYNDDTEIKQLKQVYDTAKGATEAKKAELTFSLETSIQAKRDELSQLNHELVVKQNKASEREFSPSLYNAEFGEALADAAKDTVAEMNSSGGWCATGVSRTLAKFGITTGGNGCDYLEVMRGENPNFPEAAEYFQEIEVSRDELASLPAGCIVVWDTEDDPNIAGVGSGVSSAGAIYGHVSITDGNGKEHSDKTWGQTVYRDQKYYVFMPVKNPLA